MGQNKVVYLRACLCQLQEPSGLFYVGGKQGPLGLEGGQRSEEFSECLVPVWTTAKLTKRFK